MKLTFLPAFISSVILLSCSKSQSRPALPPNLGQWKINNFTFKATTTILDSDNDGFITLVSMDSTDNRKAIIYFSNIPSGNYYYNVVQGVMEGTKSDSCTLLVGSTTEAYVSETISGEKVFVTISGGKISASFNNILVEGVNDHDTTRASGNLIQQ
jgi:hypothetical protein